ncbi:MAG TPA: Ig-like domain-containing protein, partial [Pyrinomonadaceae bacterium]|nr:Ig-like domain-containing protein [Pyrinomonadaceae bacterium]
MKTRQRALCWLLVYASLFGALPAPSAARQDEFNFSFAFNEYDGKKTGLQFRLSEGAEQPETRATPGARPAAQTLSEAETQRVLRRLPPMKPAPADEQQFAMREGSLPPPRAGRTIQTAFPAPETSERPAPAGDSKVAQVLRVAPEGEVSLAPQLSVTFSEPMVALTSHAELSAQELPVELSPQTPGRWRWVGTRTLLFVPEGRFPMATEFKATVRAGAKSATGQALAGGRAWGFSTPPPALVDSYPKDGKASRSPLVFLAFDQRVEPSAVLGSVRVTSGARAFRTRLATRQEVEQDA